MNRNYVLLSMLFCLILTVGVSAQTNGEAMPRYVVVEAERTVDFLDYDELKVDIVIRDSEFKQGLRGLEKHLKKSDMKTFTDLLNNMYAAGYDFVATMPAGAQSKATSEKKAKTKIRNSLIFRKMSN